MRYILCGINAKYIHSNLAIYSLQAYAREKMGREEYAIKKTDKESRRDKGSIDKPEILIREYTINHYVDDILQDLYQTQADVFVFSTYIWNVEYVKEVAAELKKVLPESAIWAGGPEVSYDAIHFLEQNPAVDLIMQGEGEEVFYQLTQHYDGSPASLPAMAGIAVGSGRKDYGFAALMDMDELPFVYEDFHLFEHKILYYETSRGCPFHCSYCLSSIDKTVRFRSLDKVMAELDRFLQAQVPQVKFVDRTFNCDRERALKIWRYVTEHDNGVTNFHFEISSDLLDDESLQLFSRMRPGLIQLEIGVQSTNPPTIDAISRHMNLPELFRRVDQVHALGNIHQHLDLIAGLPYESYEQFGRSFDDLYVHAPDQLQLGFLKVLKGTQMMLDSREHDIRYRQKPPYEVLSTPWLSYGDVIALKGIEELVELYYNSGQYTHTLRYVLSRYGSAFAFYESFSGYYRGKNLHKMNHNRLQKYEILRDFLGQLDMELPLLDQLLLYDLYLRENVKGRPDWAPDLSAHKKIHKEMYRTRGAILYPQIPAEEYDSRKAANQSHMEHFSFDICAYTQQGIYQEGDYLCLFDYQQRNPLNQEAGTVCLEVGSLMEDAQEG